MQDNNKIKQVIHSTISLTRNTHDVINRIEGRQMRFANHLLFPSEIHTLVYISEHIEKNFTSIAEGLGITKGALSKSINKLEGKKMLFRKYRDGNKKSVYFEITDEGIKSVKAHSDFHRSLSPQYPPEFISFIESNHEIVMEFLDYAQGIVENLENLIDSIKEKQ